MWIYVQLLWFSKWLVTMRFQLFHLVVNYCSPCLRRGTSVFVVVVASAGKSSNDFVDANWKPSKVDNRYYACYEILLWWPWSKRQVQILLAMRLYGCSSSCCSSLWYRLSIILFYPVSSLLILRVASWSFTRKTAFFVVPRGGEYFGNLLQGELRGYSYIVSTMCTQIKGVCCLLVLFYIQ